jgi:hypothetical protein
MIESRFHAVRSVVELTVDLTCRLPDINRNRDLPPEYEEYGRFAVLNNGRFWNGDIRSSHPPNTRDGFYWAIRGSTLFLSPRGSTYNWPQVISDDLIRWLVRRLALSASHGRIRVIGR